MQKVIAVNDGSVDSVFIINDDDDDYKSNHTSMNMSTQRSYPIIKHNHYLIIINQNWCVFIATAFFSLLSRGIIYHNSFQLFNFWCFPQKTKPRLRNFKYPNRLSNILFFFIWRSDELYQKMIAVSLKSKTPTWVRKLKFIYGLPSITLQIFLKEQL